MLITKHQNWRNTKIPYEKLTDNNVRKFLQDKAKSNPVKHISDIKGTVFSYPTVTYSTWDSMKMPHLKTVKQRLPSTPSILNLRAITCVIPYITQGLSIMITTPVLNKVPTDKLLANYVLPLCAKPKMN